MRKGFDGRDLGGFGRRFISFMVRLVGQEDEGATFKFANICIIATTASMYS